MVSDSDLRAVPPETQEPIHPRWLYAESLRIITADCRAVHPRFRDTRSSHPFWAVYLAPTAGLAFELDDGSQHRADQRSCLLIPPWLPFRHRFSGDDCPHCYVLFSLPLIPPQIGLQACAGPVRLRDPALVAAHRRFAGLAPKLGRLERALHGQAIAARSLLALAALLPTAQRDLLLDPQHAAARLQPALTYIDEHLADAIAVADLARLLDCGDDHCSRLFRRHLGQTPVAYIIARRVQRAAMLMTDTAHSLDEIAIRCGFANRQYLSRQFQRHLGVPPSQYRHMAHREQHS
jgi:AraC-like DNA-binding protein